METAEKLIEIAGRQRDLLAELEQEVKVFDALSPVKERKRLEADLHRVKAELEELKKQQRELSDENKGLKTKLYDQVFNEKVTIIKHTTEKLDIYFRSGIAGEENALKRLEASVKARTETFKTTLGQERIEAQAEIEKKLSEVTVLLEQKRAMLKQTQQMGPYSPEDQEKLQHLKQEPITDEQMNRLAKKNNIESLVGLSILNKVGIFLILIGIIAASRYTYLLLPDLLKGILMFAFGGGMLMGGELLNRKKANIFSLGITSGGLAALYIALSVSYFGLGIVTVYVALFLCILITVTAFLLSTRYNSQTILSFALIGGYLPIFSIGGGVATLYAVVLYFVVLNLLALIISFGRKWTVATFIGLGLNMGGTICISLFFFISNAALGQAFSMGYVLFAFLVYTLIPIFGTYREKGKFKVPDVVLIAINTFFSSMMMYLLFFIFGLRQYSGLLTIFFAAIYLLLGRMLETKFTKERNMTVLFYMTGLAFVVLTVPIQFGVAWLSMGWLIEGTVILIYGILNKEKVFKLAGLIISGLCLASFLLFDVIVTGILWPLYYAQPHLFDYKYFAITLASIAILWVLIYKGEAEQQSAKFYKNAVLVNLWLYIQFVILKLVKDFIYLHVTGTAFNLFYLVVALSVVCTLLYAYGILRVKVLADEGTKRISLILQVVGILLWLILNTGRTLIFDNTRATALTVIVGAILLIAILLLSMMALKDVVGYFVVRKGLGTAFYPLILSVYFVVVLTQIMLFQYRFDFSSAAISIVYVVTAFSFIVLGFMRRYGYLRIFGLGLAILSVVKLFLVDLYFLTQGYKILSYFILGLVLLAISFVYQYFNKRLDIKEEGKGND